MRIILSCLQSAKRHSIPAYGFWRDYFVNGCREAGIDPLEVPDVDWAEGLACSNAEERAAWRDRTWEAVLAFVRRERARGDIAFFLGYLYPEQVESTAIQEIERLGIPCVNFFCDNVREFRRVPEQYRPFSLHWVPEFEALAMYRHAGVPHVNAPMPCWVPPQLRSIPIAESEPASFIGSSDVLRRHLLGRSLEGGAEFVIRGPGWSGDLSRSDQSQPGRSLAQLAANQLEVVKVHGLRGVYHKVAARVSPLQLIQIPAARLGPALSREEYVRITREAVVTIGVNRVPTALASLRRPLTYSRLRDLEAPMLGACYLTEWTRGLERLYERGTEIETYRSAEELCEQLAALTRDRARRVKMRRLAQRRALNDHTVARSLRRIAEHLSVTVRQ